MATLSDLARLRVLRLLAREELSVGELAIALQLPQSTVSRHLKTLHAGGWIVRRTEGTASLYRMVESALDQPARDLWAITQQQIGQSPTFREDDVRLDEVLAQRRTDSRDFFGRVGGDWDRLRRELFGDVFTESALLALLDPSWVVADLGCGTGNAAQCLSSYVRRVIAIDREPAMIDAARAQLAGASNIEFRQGDLESLPLKDKSIDAAVTLLVLHHVPEPERAISEIARVLRPGGVMLVVDMVRHDREEYKHSMGHLHLGFDRRQLGKWTAAAGLGELHMHRLRPAVSGKGPGLFVATARKPA